MFEANTHIIAHHHQTVDLNWKYRKQYLVKEVLFNGTMQSLEDRGSSWLIHYRSEEYGVSQASLSYAEMADLRDEEPNAALVLDALPVTVVPGEPSDEPSIEDVLGDVVSNPSITVLDIPEGPSDYATEEDFPLSAAEQLKMLQAANPGHILVVHSSPAAAAASPELVAVVPVPAAETKVVEYMGKAVDIGEATPADVELLTKHGIIKPLSETTLGTVEMLAKVAEQLKDAPAQIIGGKKPKVEKTPKEQTERKAKPVKAAKQLMALPKLPEPVELPPLVIPVGTVLLMNASIEQTPEMQKLTKKDSTQPTQDWYVAENSSGESSETLWDTILNRGVVSPEFRYWMTPTLQRWTNPAGIGVRWVEIPFSVILSTATGFFVGRALGIALTHRNGHEEAHGNNIAELLDIEMGNEFTPEVVQAMIGELIGEATKASMERVRMVGRLLVQLINLSRQPLPNYTAAQIAALRDESKEWHQLVWGCRKISWPLNLTNPSGHAFLHGLRTPQRMFFSREENALLNHLLRLTNKTLRP